MDYWPSYIPNPSSFSESVDDPYIEATSETGDDAARVRYSKERQGPTKLTWKIMRLGDFVALKQFYAEHRAIEFLWLHPSRGLTYKTRFVSSPISSSEDGKSPFVAQVEVTLQIVELAPTEQEQPSASDLMETINIGADKAVQAAIDAEQARDEAGGYAQKAAASAKEAADTAAQIPAAVETGIERIEAAGTSQVTAVKNAGSEQVTKVKAEGQTQTAAAKAQADAAAASAEEAAERLAEFKDLGATAKTLAAGSNATASFDSSTGVITIGVPIGDKGDKGDKGDPGTFSEDGVTVVANASGEAMAKDVAIGGDVSDLASKRGQIGNYRARFAAGQDLNDAIQAGVYAVSPGCASVPMSGTSDYYVLEVLRDNSNVNGVTQFIHSRVNTAGPTWSRRRISNGTWQPWQQLVQTNYIGDGVRVSRSKALPDGTGGLCILSVPEYEGATASAAGTSGLVPPAAASQRESFLTGGGEYKPALSTGGGVLSGSIQINDLENAIGAAPSTSTERGLFLADKNSVVMGGFDVIQRASDNAKYTQFYSKNSSGYITSLAAVTYEDGTRELVADSPLQINDIQIKQVVDGGRRVIVLSGARGNQGHSFRFSPDTGEAYMDGRVIHAKADTAGYADTAGSANALGGKAESALSVAYASEAQISYGL